MDDPTPAAADNPPADASPTPAPTPAMPPRPAAPPVVVRLDKWLQIARVFKTRTAATKAVELNRVAVNGQRAKAHRHLQLGDKIEVEITKDWKRVLVVRELVDKILPKIEVPRIFEDLSPPKPQLDPVEKLMRRPAVTREKGAGRPTKRDRRDMERWRDEP